MLPGGAPRREGEGFPLPLLFLKIPSKLPAGALRRFFVEHDPGARPGPRRAAAPAALRASTPTRAARPRRLEAGDRLEVLDRREDISSSPASEPSSARLGSNQRASTISDPSTSTSAPLGATARKKYVSKRIDTSGGVIQRRERDERGGIGQRDPDLLLDLADGGRAVGRVAGALVRVDGAAREHPGAAHEARLRGALGHQDLESVGAAADDDHRRRLPRLGRNAALAEDRAGLWTVLRHHASLLCARMSTDTDRQWICESCGFIYDPEEGDPDGGIDEGTAFEDIPKDWYCPVCGASKARLLALRGLVATSLHLRTALESRGAERGLRLPLEALVFAVGLSTWGPRSRRRGLLAPFFGTSTVIWANTIAVVLLALSAGYKLGGTLADRRPSPRALCACVLVGSGLLAVAVHRAPVPVAERRRVRRGVGRGVRGLAVRDARAGGGAACCCWARCRRGRRGSSSTPVEEAGAVRGRLYAISTVGSLIGVFFVALWSIEAIGSQRTFLVLALLPGARRRGLAVRPARAARAAGARRRAACIPPGATKPRRGGRPRALRARDARTSTRG